MNTLQAPYRVRFSDGTDRPTITLQAGRHFRLYPLGLRGDVSETLPARMIDFIRLGTAVHVVDGLLRRSSPKSGFRNPHLEIEVIDTTFWNHSTVAKTLKSCLDFLSGDDDWQIRFVRDQTTRPTHQRPLGFSEPTVVCPYSGGLDSAAGLASRLREQPDRTFIPVVVRHQYLRGRLVLRQFELLKQRYQVDPSRFLPLIVAAFVRNRRLHRDFGIRTREITHRCRSFLFTVLGSMVAAVEGSDRVELYESGIGAVNLPLTRGMSGWRTTRGTHPHFLRIMSQLASLVAERPIMFNLPFINETKASMAAVLARDRLGELALATVSCILHPLRRGNTKQCGVCPACVYRRYALQSAAIPEPGQAYHYDLFGSAAALKAVPAKGQHALQAFLYQVDKLAELDAGETVPRFFRDHLLGTKVVLDKTAMGPFVDLFRRYRHEWLELAARGQTRGGLWADWLAPKKVAV